MKINSLQVEIDGIDKEILRDLMEDARKPILHIDTTLWLLWEFIWTKPREIRKPFVT